MRKIIQGVILTAFSLYMTLLIAGVIRKMLKEKQKPQRNKQKEDYIKIQKKKYIFQQLGLEDV